MQDDDFTEVYQRLYKPLCHLFHSMGFPREGASDLVQETFAKAWNKREGFREDARLSTWVWTIALNVGREALRRPAHRRESTAAELEPAELACDLSLTEGLVLHPNAMTLACVRRQFARFADQHPERAQALWLSAVEQWTPEELAPVLGRTPRATAQYLSESRKKLVIYLRTCQ